MASLRSIGVATITAGALALAAVVPAGASSVPPTTTTTPPPTVPPFTAGPTTSTTTVVTEPGQTTTTVAPSPAAGLLVLPEEPLGPEAMEVVNALYEARELIIVVGMNPDAAGLDEELDRHYARSSPARGTIESIRAQLREDGFRVYPNDSVPWALHIETAVSFFNEPFPRATVEACNIDSAILYEPAGAPDGSDVIVNDLVYASRLRFTMVPEDGGWQLLSAVALTEQVEARACEES